MRGCPFCDIVRFNQHENLLSRTQEHIVFYSDRPQKKVHIIVAPIQHFQSLLCMRQPEVDSLIGAVLSTVHGQQLDGFKIVFNVGEKGGQRVPHACAHILSAGYKDRR